MSLNPETSEGTECSFITKEFLEKAISECEGKLVHIVSYKVTPGSKVGDNYMSLIYSVNVSLSTGDLRHLLIKCYPSHPARQEWNNNSNIFHKEMQVYQTWFRELKRFQTEVLGLGDEQIVNLPYPKFIYGETIDFESGEGEEKKSSIFQPKDNYIIMEDLKAAYGFRMTNRRQTMDIDHMRLVYSALAKVHALSWAYRHHVNPEIVKKFPFLTPGFTDEQLTLYTDITNKNINEAIMLFDQEHGPGNELSLAAKGFQKHTAMVSRVFVGEMSWSDGFEKFFKSPNPDPMRFGKDSENPEPWKIISHGDCWSNNMLFRYDEKTQKPIELVLVDLQCVGETCVVNDLQYATYASTDAAFRKEHLDGLLQLYHDTFNNICSLLKTPTLPGFSMDSLKFRFHRAKFMGYYAAGLVLPVSLKEDQHLVDLEKLDKDTDLMKAFGDLSGNVEGNSLLKRRLIDVTQDMIADGVL